MSRYACSSKAVIHQAEPSIRSGYTDSQYTSSTSSYYSTSTSSGSSTPRTSQSYYNHDPHSYTVRDFDARDHSMSVHSRGNVVVINRKHGSHESGAPASYQPSSWATKEKLPKKN